MILNGRTLRSGLWARNARISSAHCWLTHRWIAWERWPALAKSRSTSSLKWSTGTPYFARRQSLYQTWKTMRTLVTLTVSITSPNVLHCCYLPLETYISLFLLQLEVIDIIILSMRTTVKKEVWKEVALSLSFLRSLRDTGTLYPFLPMPRSSTRQW